MKIISLFILLNSLILSAQVINHHNYSSSFEIGDNIMQFSVGNNYSIIDIANYSEKRVINFDFIISNPSCESITIETKNKENITGTYLIFSLSGKLIKENKFKVQDKKLFINANINNGLYILNILIGGHIYQEKIVISC